MVARGQVALETKADFQRLACRLLEPLLPYYSPGGAGVSLGHTGATYDATAIRLEGFSRPLWALAPLWHGGGQGGAFLGLYQKGLVHGTDPAHPEYWGVPEEYDQRCVEMAAIATGLLLCPGQLWEPLSGPEQQRLAAWLYTINGQALVGNNWQFFRVLVNVALYKRGMPYDAEKMEQSLGYIESFYLAEGWYKDGATGQRDYYNPFAIHYYSLLYAAFMQREDPARCALFRERALVFAQSFVYWFSEAGAALPFGRSLTYRFAQVGFFSACLFAGIQPFPLPVMKGLVARHLAWWMRQPIFARDGVLSIGYGYENLLMSEVYNAPGSPYWGMKTFLLLALPDGHPFWAAPAAPLPPLARLRAIQPAGMLVHRRGQDVTAYTPGLCEAGGCGGVAQKYAKFAYSTTFGFNVSRSDNTLEALAPDSMLVFQPKGMQAFFVRGHCLAHSLDAAKLVARWSPCPGVRVVTTLYPTADGHRRVHEIHSEAACTVYDCGFAVPGRQARQAAGLAQVYSGSGLGCSVRDAHEKGEGMVIVADPNTNLLYPNTCIPAVRHEIGKGFTQLTTVVAAAFAPTPRMEAE